MAAQASEMILSRLLMRNREIRRRVILDWASLRTGGGKKSSGSVESSAEKGLPPPFERTLPHALPGRILCCHYPAPTWDFHTHTAIKQRTARNCALLKKSADSAKGTTERRLCAKSDRHTSNNPCPSRARRGALLLLHLAARTNQHTHETRPTKQTDNGTPLCAGHTM